MCLESFLSQLEDKGIPFSRNEPMCRHTTFGIGGAADVFIKLSNTAGLVSVIKSAFKNNVPIFVLGRGSNLLVSDSGIEGAVISLSGMDEIRFEGNKMICGAGVKLSRACIAARDNGLSGLEFAYGIPGSVGGALFMNAGAYGGEMSNAVISAECVDTKGNILTLSAENMQLGYRTSIFKTSGLIITSVTLELNTCKACEINAAMEDFLSRRKEKQPLEYPSAGSVFKRPEGHFAGALIEKNSLKGVSVGGAKVSEKHAGFIINTGGATCSDVKTLIDIIRKTVKKNDGVLLETEIISVGR